MRKALMGSVSAAVLLFAGTALAAEATAEATTGTATGATAQETTVERTQAGPDSRLNLKKVEQHLQQAEQAIEQENLDQAQQSIEQAKQALQNMQQAEGDRMAQQAQGQQATRSTAGQEQQAQGRESLRQLEDQLEQAERALQDDDTEQAQQALDQADQALEQSLQQAQGETQQQLQQVEESLRQADEALQAGDTEQAMAAIEQAREPIQQARTSSGETDVDVVVAESDDAASERDRQAQGERDDAENVATTADREARYGSYRANQDGAGQVAGGLQAEQLLDAEIVNREGDTVAQVEDLLIGEDGKIDKLIAGTGGFLGMGKREVMLNIEDLQVEEGADGSRLIADLTEQQLENMPDYDEQEGAWMMNREE